MNNIMVLSKEKQGLDVMMHQQLDLLLIKEPDISGSAKYMTPTQTAIYIAIEFQMIEGTVVLGILAWKIQFGKTNFTVFFPITKPQAHQNVRQKK